MKSAQSVALRAFRQKEYRTKACVVARNVNTFGLSAQHGIIEVFLLYKV